MPTGSSRAIGPTSSSEGGADDSDERSESERDMFDMIGVLARCDAFEGEVTVDKSAPRRSSLTDATRLKRGFHAPGLSGIINGTS